MSTWRRRTFALLKPIFREITTGCLSKKVDDEEIHLEFVEQMQKEGEMKLAILKAFSCSMKAL